MSSKPAIVVSGLSKQYQLYDTSLHRLREVLFGSAHHRVFNALRDVSLRLEKGEVLGVMGRNGAGKSTLLQLLSGTLNPTAGRIELDGKVTALLELGSGFSPDFTGRENVYLYGSIMGLTKGEVGDRMEEILGFADIGSFIDQPLRTYSSGMAVRLAFATIVLLEPDIMIVDEALAVGDAQFQIKCMRRINELKSQGKTFVLASHSADQVVTFCTRVIVLEAGEIVFDGSPKEAIHIYKSLLFPSSKKRQINKEPRETKEKRVELTATSSDFSVSEYRFGTGDGRIEDLVLLTTEGIPSHVFSANEEVVLRVRARAKRHVKKPVYGLRVRNRRGLDIYVKNTLHKRLEYSPILPGEAQDFEIRFIANLVGGEYFLSVGLVDFSDGKIVNLDRRMDVLQMSIVSGDGSTGLANLNAEFAAV